MNKPAEKTWTLVEVQDRYAGAWQWGRGPYFDWCNANCASDYSIVKYNAKTIYGSFRNPADAALFALRWL